MTVTDNETNTAQTLAASEESCAGQCSCTNPCRCLRPYELKVKVVTRLAGIPVEGVALSILSDEQPGQAAATPIIFKSNSDGEYNIHFAGRQKNLRLRLVYANETERLKAEEVTVDLKNLLPSCRSKWLATADFHHIIKKIQDVLGDIPSEGDIKNAEEEFKKAEEEWQKLQTSGSTISADIIKKAYDDLDAAKRNLDRSIVLTELNNALPGYPAVPCTLPEQEQKNVEEKEKALRKITAAAKSKASAEEIEAAHKKKEAANTRLEELKRQREAAKTAAGGAANVDMDFEDEYQIKATNYTAPQADAETTPVPPNGSGAEFENVDSFLQLEPAADGGRMRVHLRVSLATFSLAVPYISQTMGHVKATKEDVPAENPTIGLGTWAATSISSAPATQAENNADTATAPLSKSGKIYVGREDSSTFAYASNNPWQGEKLCSPTVTTMILKYYGLVGSIGDAQARADVVGAFVDKYGEQIKIVTEDKNGKEVTKYYAPWELAYARAAILLETPKTILAPRTVPNLQGQDHSCDAGLNSAIKTLLLPLSYGHPIAVSIKGAHIIAVRGAVINRDGTKAWAIANDPYGTLAGDTADYSKDGAYAWYQDIGKGSSQRQGRNTATGTEAERTKGLHVYYGSTTHTREGSSKVKADLGFNNGVSITYRHPDDAQMLRKEFVRHNLVKGK